MAARRDDDENPLGAYRIEERRLIARARRSGYDALAFAKRALRILEPRGVDVAIYEGRFELKVERGRYFRAGPESHWAMVAIPPSASREQIAVVLAEIAGVAHVPLMIETLIAAANDS